MKPHTIGCAALLTLLALLRTCAALTSPMPYRPGYGLGSWIPEDVVTSMREEAEKRVEIMTLNNLEAEARSVEREVLLAAQDNGDGTALPKSEADSLVGEIRRTRRDMWNRKMTAVRSYLDSVAKSVSQTGKPGAFTTFARGYQSPVSWSGSTMGSADRSFDSLNIGVHFVQVDENQEDGSGTVHGQRVAAQLNNNTHTVTGGASQMSRDAARLAAEKTQRIAALQKVVGTLLVSSFATHRKVMHFEKLAVDVDALWRGWNYQNINDTIANPILQRDEFASQLATERARTADTAANTTRVSIVSEMYMGSVIIGMVHFVSTQKTTMSYNTSSNRTAKKFNEDISENIRTAQKVASQVGSTQLALEEARKIASLGSSAGLDVQFDLVSIGFIPQLRSNPVQQTVSQLNKFDPGDFSIPSVLSQADVSTALAAVQSNMAAVIDATIAAVDKTQVTRTVLDVKSFMDAFDDFSSSAKKGDAMGAPIGMNIAQFSKLDVMGQLANKYLNSGVEFGVDL